MQRVEVLTLHGPRRHTTGDVFVDKRSADEPASKVGVGRLDLEPLIEGWVSQGYLNGLGAQPFLLKAVDRADGIRGPTDRAVLSRSSGEDVVVCIVAPPPWLPGVVREDTVYEKQIEEMTDSALAQARTELPSDVPATFNTVKARSTSTGLLEAASRHGASVIAVGSSAAGLFGRISLSSVADRLLHSSHVPIALAPRGFRVGDTDKVDCVTVAYTGTEQCDSLLRAAADLVSQFGTKMRLASFAVQPAPPVTAMFRAESADVVAEWTATIQAAARRVLGDSKSLSEGVVIGQGHDWETALNDIDWHDGDLLVLGSSESGPVSRVFLGSRAAKIIRHAPVAVLVVPRTTEKQQR